MRDGQCTARKRKPWNLRLTDDRVGYGRFGGELGGEFRVESIPGYYKTFLFFRLECGESVTDTEA